MIYEWQVHEKKKGETKFVDITNSIRNKVSTNMDIDKNFVSLPDCFTPGKAAIFFPKRRFSGHCNVKTKLLFLLKFCHGILNKIPVSRQRINHPQFQTRIVSLHRIIANLVKYLVRSILQKELKAFSRYLFSQKVHLRNSTGF